MVIDERTPIEPRMPGLDVAVCDWNEMMRIDEPETYAKMQEYNYKAGNLLSGDWSLDSNDMIPDNIKNEYQELKSKAWDIRHDWFSRKCMTDKASVLVNPVEKQYAVIDSMESKYQNTSFNVYSDIYADIEGIIDRHSGMWRFSTKYNIQVSNYMLSKMTSDPDSEETKNYMDQIDKAVDAMKTMDSQYDGSDEYLRFGVKLGDDGSVTYRANIFRDQ